MDYKTLTQEQQGHVRIVRFNRPERANAVTYEMLLELEACAFALREDAQTRVVVFTGAGRHFCSGWDLDDRAMFEGPLVLTRRRMQAGGRAIRALLGIDQITP